MRRIRKRYQRPMLPYDRARMEDERAIMKEFGLRKKEEILVAEQILRGFRQMARQLIAQENEQQEKVLIDKMLRLGLLTEKGAGLDDVLALEAKDVLARRLQSIVLKKGLAKSIANARQLITHGHIAINGRRMRFPSYVVPIEEEAKIAWYETSVMKEPRKPKPKKVPKEEKAEKKKPEEESKETPPEAEKEKPEEKEVKENA